LKNPNEPLCDTVDHSEKSNEAYLEILENAKHAPFFSRFRVLLQGREDGYEHKEHQENREAYQEL
jgi:hypothetical protein